MKTQSGCQTINSEGCARCSKKILAWTVAGNTFLAGIKIIGGIYANSSGLLADGFQSLSCVATSIIVMASFAFSRRSFDERFPYGYAKLDYIVAFSAFSILIGLGAGIALSSVLGILRRDFAVPDIMVLPVALTSAFLTYVMYRYNYCAGTKLDSPAMIANGAHAGADLFSSAAVILGIVLSQFGPSFAFCDRVAALFVGIIIVKDSLVHWVANMHIMLDQIPDPGFAHSIGEHIMRVRPDYRAGTTKFKRIGKKFWVGLSLQCPPGATAHDVHLATIEMRQALAKDFPLIGEMDFFIESA